MASYPYPYVSRDMKDHRIQYNTVNFMANPMIYCNRYKFSRIALIKTVDSAGVLWPKTIHLFAERCNQGSNLILDKLLIFLSKDNLTGPGVPLVYAFGKFPIIETAPEWTFCVCLWESAAIPLPFFCTQQSEWENLKWIEKPQKEFDKSANRAGLSGIQCWFTLHRECQFTGMQILFKKNYFRRTGSCRPQHTRIICIYFPSYLPLVNCLTRKC